MSKLLHQKYIDTLLSNPDDLFFVRFDLLTENGEQRQEIESGFVLAKILLKAIQSAENDPDRRAAIAFLKELGGEKDE